MTVIYSESEKKRLELLSRVKRQLWFAGMHRRKIRPLHRQVVLGRDIVISEDISLHLVTRDGKTIFIKPFSVHLLELENEGAVSETVVVTRSARNDDILLGFISSYLSMIQFETDLRIALDNYLLPSILLPRDLRNKRIESKEELEKAFREWTRIKETWEGAIQQIKDRYSNTPIFHNRFDRGELRLDRLNAIIFFFEGQVRGYQRLDTTYSTYFQSFFAVVSLTVFAFTSIALSAFQVAMSYSNVSLELAGAGYWFSIVMMIFLVALIATYILWFVIVFMDNLVYSSLQP